MIPGTMDPIGMVLINSNAQTCALIDQANNVVVNLIMADPLNDPAPNGMLLIGLPERSPVNFNWIYDSATGQFTDPNISIEGV